jgi:hypothetical protein
VGGGKGFSDWIGASFDPFGSIFGDSLGFDPDPIGNMIGTGMSNVTGLLTFEKDFGDVQDNMFGRNWIGDMINPAVGGRSRQMIQQEETNRMYNEQLLTGHVTPANEDLWKPFRTKAKAPEIRLPEQGQSLLADAQEDLLG